MKKRAFTLIEMLVVILIIMILAGYAIFAYLDSLYEGEFAQGKSRLELINAGYERFALEYPSAASNLNKGDSSPFSTVTTLKCDRTNRSPNTLIHCGYIPQMDFAGMKFTYYLGNGCVCTGCNGYAYMKANKTGVKLGKYAGKCAGISLMQGGKAVDGD